MKILGYSKCDCNAVTIYTDTLNYSCKQEVEKHKAKHIERGDLPDYANGEVEASVANVSKIYNIDSLSGHFETNESGWY